MCYIYLVSCGAYHPGGGCKQAQGTANKIALAIIFLALLIIGRGRLMGNLEYTLIAFVIVTALAMALAIFLSEYLLYRYDHDEQFDESGE